MHLISQHFGVSMISVTSIVTITLSMHRSGATASGWLGDRIGRKKPQMVAILGCSLCDLAANLATFLASCMWGLVADKWARRGAMIIPAFLAVPLAPLYLIECRLRTDMVGLPAARGGWRWQ